jgi:phage terminase small subunit
MPDPAPAPPDHLSAESRKLWRELVEAFAFEPAELRLLRLALEALDRSAQARRAIKRDGLFVLDRFETLRAHPAVDVELKSRRAFAQLVAHLDLPEDAAVPATGTVHRLRKVS